MYHFDAGSIAHLEKDFPSLLQKCDVFSKFRSNLLKVLENIHADDKMFSVTS